VFCNVLIRNDTLQVVDWETLVEPNIRTVNVSILLIENLRSFMLWIYNWTIVIYANYMLMMKKWYWDDDYEMLIEK
jgi:hypothetical protein